MMINRIFESLATQFDLKVQDLNKNEILEKITELDSELTAQLKLLMNQYDILLFIRGDFELRHKMKDIYTLQLKQAQSTVDETLATITSHCLAKGLNPPETTTFEL